MPGRARKAAIEVDHRTEGMTAAALECRDVGHAWDRQVMGPKRRAELARLGQAEKIQICSRCGCEKTTLWDVVERRPISHPRTNYPEGYLMNGDHAGSGRLSRAEAYIASLVRTGELS